MSWREEKIVEILESGGELKVTQITKAADMSKVTALKHLKNLANNKIVDYKQIGPTKLWYLANKKDPKEGPKTLEHNWLLEIFNALKKEPEMEISINIKNGSRTRRNI